MAKTKDDFLREAIQFKLAANAACGCGDPYPMDVKAQSCFEAYLALGGTEDEIGAEWRKAYDSTPHHQGGGLR